MSDSFHYYDPAFDKAYVVSKVSDFGNSYSICVSCKLGYLIKVEFVSGNVPDTVKKDCKEKVKRYYKLRSIGYLDFIKQRRLLRYASRIVSMSLQSYAKSYALDVRPTGATCYDLSGVQRKPVHTEVADLIKVVELDRIVLGNLAYRVVKVDRFDKKIDLVPILYIQEESDINKKLLGL